MASPASGASNREIAKRADIADQGQMSKLLTRLARLELITNVGEGQEKGMCNAWHLTDRGARRASDASWPERLALSRRRGRSEWHIGAPPSSCCGDCSVCSPCWAAGRWLPGFSAAGPGVCCAGGRRGRLRPAFIEGGRGPVLPRQGNRHGKRRRSGAGPAHRRARSNPSPDGRRRAASSAGGGSLAGQAPASATWRTRIDA